MPAKADTIHTAFLAAQRAFPSLSKDAAGQVGSRRYKYASLQSVLDTVVPVLNEHDLTLTQSTFMDEGILLMHTRVTHAPTGESLEASLPLPIPEDWQKWGSAMTYARRYALQAFLGITPDDDDDAGTAQGFRGRDPGADNPVVDRAKAARAQANEAFKTALEMNDLLLDAPTIHKVAIEAATFAPMVSIDPAKPITSYPNEAMHALAKAVLDHGDEIKANLGLDGGDA